MSSKHSHYVWPVGIICFFIVLAAFYAFYVIPLALEEGSSSVSDNPYEDANAYQEVIDSEQLASRVGLDKVTIEVTPGGESTANKGTVLIDISMLDPAWRRDIREARLKMAFTRTDAFDFEAELVRVGSEALKADISLPSPGLWMLELRVEGPDGLALLRRSQMIP